MKNFLQNQGEKDTVKIRTFIVILRLRYEYFSGKYSNSNSLTGSCVRTRAENEPLRSFHNNEKGLLFDCENFVDLLFQL